MKDVIRIAIVEDNPVYASSLEEIIHSTENMDCVASLSNAEHCTRTFLSDPPPLVDIVLLDLKLPDLNGMTLIPVIRERTPDARIIVLTSKSDYRTVLEAIQVGASGYVLKEASVATLCQAIQDVHDGGTVIDPQLASIAIKALSNDDQEWENPLSKREQQVLELMAMGYLKKQVAAELGISYRAVALYTENIYKKLSVPNITAAVSRAIRQGLI